jgi:hypothetical protein
VEGSAVCVNGEAEAGGDLPTVHSLCPKVKQQVPPLRYPDFLSRLVALANFMRLSLLKAAHVDAGERRVAGNPGTLRSG